MGKLGFVGGSVGSFGNRLGFSRVLIGNSQLCKPARGRTLKSRLQVLTMSDCAVAEPVFVHTVNRQKYCSRVQLVSS